MSRVEEITRVAEDEDHAALYAACDPGVALCTIVGIEGSFSRRVGAQMAVLPDGRTVGSLADGCLERQLVGDVQSLQAPEIRRYGSGSAHIDFRLPCGGGLDILLDPAPDRAACRSARAELERRSLAALSLPSPSLLSARHYIPCLQLRVIGEGPELAALVRLASAMQIPVAALGKGDLTLGTPSGGAPADRWTAVVLLFHDHEWELALIEEALAGEAFYIGAQGGESARIRRSLDLLARGVAEERLARLRSPIGTFTGCKTPSALALSVLSEIVCEYEKLRDRR